jgi:D-3-phosphoglycerate dehydrogenase
MKILAYDPYLKSDAAAKYKVTLLSMDEVFAQSDYIAVCCKVTPETRGMIGAAQFAKMKKTAYFINTARAVIVRQKDLVEALQKKQFAGAVLDVFWTEPLPANYPLLSMPNVLLTPHIGGASSDVALHQSAMIVEDLVNFATGKPLVRVFNRKALGL